MLLGRGEGSNDRNRPARDRDSWRLTRRLILAHGGGGRQPGHRAGGEPGCRQTSHAPTSATIWPVLSLTHIGLSFGARALFRDLDWTLGDGERVALVGPNGAGKTTLLRIALGETEPDDGQVARSRHVRTGYLPQEEIPLEGATALDCALGAFEAALDAEREQTELNELIATLPEGHPDLPALLRRLGDLQHLFEQSDGYRMRAEAERVLSGLGLSPRQIAGPLSALSGGWRMRVALARLLLARPTHLFLDEPTNHLDLPSLAWLEEYLEEFSGTLVIISHDRIFLDRTVNHVYELVSGRLESYAGNYSFFAVERERRRAALLAAQENQAKRIAELERFVERFRAKNSKARQVKSKEKMLERMERIEVRGDDKKIRFTFAPAPRAGRVMIELKGIHKTYGGPEPVFSGLDFKIERGEKVALVGPNGAGKSTLLRILGGDEPIQAGARLADERAQIAIFAQHTTDGLDLEHTVIEEVAEAGPAEPQERLRGFLGSFLFRGDDVFKQVRVLSGGEKARLAIAKTLLRPVNFLLLDEPTNHLDMAGKEVLQDALERYDGTLVVVTHDRHLIDAVANRVIEVSMGGVVRDFPGNFSDYAERLWREGRPLPGYREDPAQVLARRKEDADPAGRPGAARGAASKTAAAKPAKPPRPGAEKRERERVERERAREESRVMKTLEALEARQTEIETELATPEVYANGEKSRDLMREYERVRAEIASLWDRLGTLSGAAPAD